MPKAAFRMTDPSGPEGGTQNTKPGVLHRIFLAARRVGKTSNAPFSQSCILYKVAISRMV